MGARPGPLTFLFSAALVFVAACGDEYPAGYIPVYWPEKEREPAWSPDGSKIAYVKTPSEPDFDLGWEQIWIRSLETGEETYLAEGRLPDWSPTGDSLLFLGYGGLSVAEVPSGETRVIHSAPGLAYPKWSPKGTRIAFRAELDDGYWGIRLVSPDGSGARDFDIHASSGCDWDSSGGRIALISYREGCSGSQVAILDTLSEEIRWLTCSDTGTGYRYPDWGVEDRRIRVYFSGDSRRGPASGVYSINPDHPENAEYIGTEGWVAWSPDGRFAVAGEEAESLHVLVLWVHDMETGERVRLDSFTLPSP